MTNIKTRCVFKPCASEFSKQLDAGAARPRLAGAAINVLICILEERLWRPFVSQKCAACRTSCTNDNNNTQGCGEAVLRKRERSSGEAGRSHVRVRRACYTCFSPLRRSGEKQTSSVIAPVRECRVPAGEMQSRHIISQSGSPRSPR